MHEKGMEIRLTMPKLLQQGIKIVLKSGDAILRDTQSAIEFTASMRNSSY
jgi:hypothetical protein